MEAHLHFHTVADLHSFGNTMRASGRSLASLRLGPTPRDASHWEDPYGHAQEQQQQQQQQHEEQHGHAEQQRHAAEQHERISPVFLQHCPWLQQLHLERANWNLSSLHPSWFKALRTLTIHHSHCTASDFEFLAHITPQLHELSLYRLVVASLPVASAKDVYLNAPSMQEESVNPLANPPHSLSNPSHSPQISSNQPSISRELYSPSISESSLIHVLQSVAPTVEALMVPHSLPIESVEGEWSELHRLAIGVRGSKAGAGRCKTTVEAAEARAGGISRLYLARASDASSTRRNGGGEGGDRGSGSGDGHGGSGGSNCSSSSSSSSSRRGRKREAPRPPCINARALRSLLFATRRCNPGTLVSLQEDFPSLEIYCIVGRSFCWKPVGSERLNQPIMCPKNHQTLLIDEVTERNNALNHTIPSDAEKLHEREDVVDLLPGPIWHIIFRHLLAHHSPENRGDSSAPSQQRAGSTSNATALPFPAITEQHAKALRRFGPSWPLLRYAVASKRLLLHAISFSELESMTLLFNAQDPWWSGMLYFFLRRTPHTSLDLTLNSSQDLDSIGRLLQPSARSLTSLGLGLTEPPGGVEPIIKERHLMNPAFLEEFEQLQRLKLGRGTWQLGDLNPAKFQALKSLSIHDFNCDGNDVSFLSSVAPQLHELALASSSHGSGSTTLDFKLTAARAITVCFEKQALHLRFTMAPSLKSFSATAAFLNVDCTCGSRLSLDSLSLIGRSQLLVTSLPLASAKSVYVNGPTV
ncbi:unnamed protein product [Closterium sp. Naga37s-1]|nr:unnamed protein product [Closterium sp. Naga37s-1]